MSIYKATVSWRNSGPDFLDSKYSRSHQWHFEGGQSIQATAAPAVVPAPWSDPSCVDPEQAFVASLSSCHMLFFLHFAAREGFQVESYNDAAEGLMAKNSSGRMAMTRVTLRPEIEFAGPAHPDRETVDRLHETAHKHCFIANSVASEIVIAPTVSAGS